MQLRTVLTASAAAVFGLCAAGGTASAQPFERREPPGFPRPADFGFEGVHRAARAIEKNASDLHEELDRHFRPSPSYRHLHEHARDIERLARAVHDAADGREGRRQLRRAVERLDDEVHHFAEVVEDSRQFRNVPERAYAHLRQEVAQLHRAIVALKRQTD
jgi:hypothetical protein